MCKEGKHAYAYTKHLLFLSPCELTSSPLKPSPPPFLFAQGYRSLRHLAAFWISDFRRGPAWNQTCFTLSNLSYANLIMRPVKEPRRKQGTIKLLLHIQLCFSSLPILSKPFFCYMPHISQESFLKPFEATGVSDPFTCQQSTYCLKIMVIVWNHCFTTGLRNIILSPLSKCVPSYLGKR